MRYGLRFIGNISLVVSLLSAIGCDRSPATYPVKGKVQFEGTGQPLGKGTIVFESVADPSLLATSELSADGSFELYCTLDKPGTIPGEYRVMIQAATLEHYEKPIVKQEYQKLDTSGLTATVKPEPNELLFEIEPIKN
jgi:hypothetical protein